MKHKITTTLLRLYLQGQNYSAGKENNVFLNPRTGKEVIIPDGKETFTKKELVAFFGTTGDRPAEEEVKFLFTFLKISYPHLFPKTK